MWGEYREAWLRAGDTHLLSQEGAVSASVPGWLRPPSLLVSSQSSPDLFRSEISALPPISLLGGPLPVTGFRDCILLGSPPSIPCLPLSASSAVLPS